MSGRLRAVLRRAWVRVRRIPTALLALIALLLTGGLVWGLVEAYRVYDYVQHDNDFCLSCHLMVEPYERFARSAHRDLGCKACHRPTLVARSSMALTQIVENPDTLSVHAEVPNAVCVECHVDGDPAKWRNIARSAGHRVHLESERAELAGLQCVECHSTSVHEFAATERTCGQSGCHENQRIRLGGMGALTIHCATCHAFDAQVAAAPTDSARAAFGPGREECLACHAMQERLASFPPPAEDPHGGVCGACHDPHSQTRPSEAFGACTRCHDQPRLLTPAHRGLDDSILQACGRCHRAHTFHADARQCTDCHVDPAHPERVAPARRRTSLLESAVRVLSAVLLPTPLTAQEPGSRFDHARHTDVACTACHSMTESHGATTVTGIADCRACHHTSSVAQSCARCHEASDAPGGVLEVRRAFRPSVGTAENRTFPFDHAPHERIACSECHRAGAALSAARVNCSTCHRQHHQPGSECRACHRPARDAHTRAAHVSCTGSGCHSAAPVSASQRTRGFCLVCHQNMVTHRPGGVCVDCHALPPARQASLLPSTTRATAR